MRISSWNIFKTFFKIGTLLLGGGYVILPLLDSEISKKNQWVTTEEIVEFFALSQSLPGIIAANISIFVGHKLLGLRGAISAIAGVIMPAFLSIILIANFLAELADKHSVKSIFAGVGVGVVVLILLTVREMLPKSIIDKFSAIIFILSAVLAYLKISPVWIILGAIFVGILYKYKKKAMNKV